MCLGDSQLSLVTDSTGISPTSDIGGVSAGGGHTGGSKRRASAGGADAGEDDEGASPAGSGKNVGWHCPCQGHALSCGGRCCCHVARCRGRLCEHGLVSVGGCIR
jgi:hypothetical protein